MDRQIKRLGIGLMGLFLLLFMALNYWQVGQASSLNSNRKNTRAVVRDFSQPRGSIQTADGVVVAQSVPSKDSLKEQRIYPRGPLFGHLTGYFSFTFGTDGIERSYNDQLIGRNRPFRVDRIGDLLLQKEKTGNITLTVSDRLQQIAADKLGTRKGAVVAIEPRTGAILAMVSYPTYDPNPLALHDQAAVRYAWGSLNGNTDRPFLARAYREIYFPGSTFKVVTAATALANGKTTSDPVYPQLTELPLPQTAGQTLSNFSGERCGGPLPEILRVSCNTAFAQLGLDLGAQVLTAGAEAFGFNQRPPLDLPDPAVSSFPAAANFRRNLPALAKSAIGQQDVSASPLEMAMVASAIANNGVMMTPHVMSVIRDSNGNEVERYNPQPWRTAISPTVANTMRDLMVNVVEQGTGTAARLPGIQVAGKTGTAETGNNTSHAWFLSFAPANDPRIAVAVIVENQPGRNEATGGVVAAPIAKALLQAVVGGG